MTASELSLFSTVSYQGTNAVIIKIKDTGALLYGASSGWFSYPIPASELTLVSRFTAPGGTPSNLETAPLFSKVSVLGNQGYLIDKSITPNEWTGENYVVGLVWFMDTETSEWLDATQISFVSGGGQGTELPVEPPLPVKLPVEPPTQASMGLGTILKWGAIIGVGYYLLKGGEKPKAPTAQYVD